MIASNADFALHSGLPALPGLELGGAVGRGLVEQIVLAADGLERFGGLAKRLPRWPHFGQSWLAVQSGLDIADHIARQGGVGRLLAEHRSRRRELIEQRD
jgi:hypothetical protein